MLFRAALALFALTTACDSADTTADTTAAQSEREALIAELDSRLGDRSQWMLPEQPTDGDWSAFPQVEANPLTDEKVALGRELFYEPGLLSDTGPRYYRSVSCSTCHLPEASFGSGTHMGRGLAAGGEGLGAERSLMEGVSPKKADFAPLNERRLVNVAWTGEVGGWMGDFDPANGLGPTTLANIDLGGTELFIMAGLNGHGFFPNGETPENSVIFEESYTEMLEAAFPELDAEERTTRRTVAMALGAYVRSISTSEAPFQQMLRQAPGTDADAVPLSTTALRGANLFFGKGRCSACHTGPALASPTFHTLGTAAADPSDEIIGYTPPNEEPAGENGWGTFEQADMHTDNRGRYLSTGDEADLGGFLVPSVYGAGNQNILRYGHGAAHDNLGDFIAHKVGGSDPATNPSLDPDLLDNLSPILFSSTEAFLTDEEINDLVAFIEEGLEDPGLEDRFGLGGNISLAGYCSPNNDPVSRGRIPACKTSRLD